MCPHSIRYRPTRQAQLGQRVVFTWCPSDASLHNPLTTPWPNADELIEGVEFADEAAARCFDLERTVGESGRPRSGDVADAGPWVEFFTWEDAGRWLQEGST